MSVLLPVIGVGGVGLSLGMSFLSLMGVGYGRVMNPKVKSKVKLAVGLVFSSVLTNFAAQPLFLSDKFSQNKKVNGRRCARSYQSCNVGT
jgi:hypothetical protein